MSAIIEKSEVSTTFTPELTTINGEITTTSLQIAQHFGKRHADVIRAIRNMISEFKEDGNSIERSFALNEFTDSIGRKLPNYIINRDGFSLLAMGFTGSEARHWKYAYLTAFNKMEAALQSPTTLTATQQQQLKTAVQTVCKNDPKAYSQLYKALYARFGVPKYQDLQQSDFVDAVGFVGNYQVQTIEPVPTLLNRRWLMAYDHTGKEQLQAVPSNACVAAPEEWAKMIREAGGLFLEPQTLADIATACTERLARQSTNYMQSAKELRLKLQSH